MFNYNKDFKWKKYLKRGCIGLVCVFLLLFASFENTKRVDNAKAMTDFSSKVVNIGGYSITLQGNYNVSVWRSGNTVYCKTHVYVAAPNGAWSAMGAQVSTNKGSASKTFVGDGSAAPKAGSGDVQFSFNDAGAGTISGTIYAGFMPNLNGSQALTASFSLNYSSNTVDTHTVIYDTNGGYYKEPYKNSEGRIIVPDGNYTLQHVWSKKEKNLNQYMTIKDGNMGSGTGMVITKNDSSSAQSQWTFERYKDTSYYYIINVKSGKAISLYGNPKEGSLRNQAVGMYNQALNYDDFLWYIREDGAGEYYIINKHTRQGLTASYTTVGDGNGVFQYGEGNDTSENTIYGDSTWYFNKVSNEIRTKAYGATFYIKSNQPTRTGYTFVNWKDDKNGKYWKSEEDYTPDYKGGTNSMVAQWTPNKYTVSYNGNGADSGDTSSSSHVYDTAKNLTANGYTRNGYAFLGWSTNPNGSVQYSNGQSVKNLTATNGATVTLYAQWKQLGYEINYDGNGADGGSTSGQFVPYNQTTSLNKNGYYKKGYKFKEWNSKSNGSGESYKDQQNISVDGNKTVTKQ